MPKARVSNAVESESAGPEEWLELYGDRLYRRALHRVKDVGIAEDLVQETFISAIKSLGNFEKRSSVYTWLASILRNKILDHYRKRTRLREDFIEDREPSSADLGFSSIGFWNTYVPNWARSPDETLESADFMRAITSCLEALPARSRRILELKIADDLPQDEICKITEVSPTNYWVIIHRARLALRKCVERRWYKSEDR